GEKQIFFIGFLLRDKKYTTQVMSYKIDVFLILKFLGKIDLAENSILHLCIHDQRISTAMHFRDSHRCFAAVLKKSFCTQRAHIVSQKGESRPHPQRIGLYNS